MEKLNKNTTLGDALADPRAEAVMAKYKVPCLTCPMAKFEMQELTLGDICQTYGIDCPKLLQDLNAIKK